MKERAAAAAAGRHHRAPPAAAADCLNPPPPTVSAPPPAACPSASLASVSPSLFSASPTACTSGAPRPRPIRDGDQLQPTLSSNRGSTQDSVCAAISFGMNSSTRNGFGMMDLPLQEMDGGVCATDRASSGIEGEHISNVTSDNANESTSHISCHASQSSIGNVDSCQVAPVDDGTSTGIQTNIPIVDWSTIQIAPLTDNDIVPMSDDAMCKVLGINPDDDKRRRVPLNPPICSPEVQLMMVDAAIPVNDIPLQEVSIVYDRDNPKMEVGSLYPSMKEFRLAIRQYAINEEIDLHKPKSDPTRFMGKCKAEGCSWSITARITADKKTIRVNKVSASHQCISSSRLRSSMADQSWVEDRSIDILKTEPNITAMNLRTRLTELYDVDVGYDTVYRGRPRRSRKKVKATLLDVCNDQTNDAPITATPTTPNRISIIIPPSLENSPRPITRSLLALAMADGDGQSSMHTTSPRQITPKTTTTSTLKKITPRKNRRKLCM